MDAPEYLYHYTRVPGLLGILGDRAIRATSIHCLNDSTEFLYAFQVACRFLRRLESRFPGLATSIDEALETRLKTFPLQSRFVACFTEESDSLSQWRSYAGQGGVNLGFEFVALKGIAEATGLRLEQCRYTDAEQEAAVVGLVEAVLAEWRIPSANATWSGRLVNALLVRVRDDLASSFKHPSFAHEKEWRLATPVSSPSAGPHLTFLPGGPLVVPHLTVALEWDGTIALNSVTLGPLNRDPIAKAMITDLLATHGCRKAAGRVMVSDIPYRWTNSA